MKLDCFVFEGHEIDIRPSSPRRDWMDDSVERYAYRCLPLSIANAHGWTLHCRSGFEVEWNGGGAVGDVEVFPTGEEPANAYDHFGQGILTFATKVMFRTEPGYNLWVSGPPNSFKDGIQPLSAVIETDWMPYEFSMNWKITRPRHRIGFERGEPFCFLFPVARGLVEEMEPVLRDLREDPESERMVRYANEMRGFLSHVKEYAEKEGKSLALDRQEDRAMRFQKWYMRGEMPDGSAVFEPHQKSLRLRPFDDRRSPQ